MRLGWIGLGVMGASMAAHLRRAGHALTVTTRTRARAEPLIASGAAWADTPRAVAEASEVVFTMVGFPRDVREVVLGKEADEVGRRAARRSRAKAHQVGGALAGLRAGGVLVDMTTSEPALAVEIAAAARARGAWALDAPVSGGDVGAREARLSIMVGGDVDPFEKVKPLFDVLGRTVVHHGGPGTGQHAKAVNQTLIASNMIGVCEGLLYAHRAGLDPARVLASVGGGAAGSWSLANLAPRMLAGDFAPGFYVEHFVKDLGIVLQESEKMGLSLPGASLAKQLYERLVALGHARSGTQALILALADLSDVEWPLRPSPTNG